MTTVDLLTTAEAAAAYPSLGAVATWHRRRREGVGPAYHVISTRVYYARVDIEQYIASTRVDPAAAATG